MAKDHFFETMRLLVFVLFVATLHGQTPPLDLTGTWIDPLHGAFEFKQTGTALSLDLKNGIVLQGTLTGRKISLSYKWTAQSAAAHLKSDKEEGPKAAADRAAAIKALANTVVNVKGTVGPDGSFIDLTYTEQQGEANTTANTTESHAGQLAPQEFTLVRMVLQPKLRWQESKDTGTHRLQIEGVAKPVVGVKQVNPAPQVSLVLEDRGLDLSNKIQSLTIRNLIGSKRGVVYDRSLLKITFDRAASHDVITFDSKALLDSLKSSVNTDALDATVSVRDTPLSREVKADSKNVLHVYLQKLILFLPGVCGSSIYMTPPTGGDPVEVFPDLSLNIAGEQAVNRLACKQDGTPMHRADLVDLFRSYGAGDASRIDVVPPLSQLLRMKLDTTLVYDVERRDAVVSPKDHAHLMVDGKGPIRYYLVQPWPYDWRGRLENTVEQLFNGSGTKVDPPFRDPPSIQQILKAKQKDNPLLDDKVALAGHSTGGLVVRGALVHDGVRALVDRAFFIDVPFFGAPKSYYVYLKGDMGIPIIADDLMRKLSPNMPIVYYLAPNLGYPDFVVRNKDGFPFGVNPMLFPLTVLVREAKDAGLYPKDGDAMDGYNMDLQKAAWAYNQNIQREPAIGWDRCYVFYSDIPPLPTGTCSDDLTIGVVKVGKKGFECEATGGDYTVPLVSQLGDFKMQDATEKIAIKGSPKHVPAPNVEFVWEEIVKRIIR